MTETKKRIGTMTMGVDGPGMTGIARDLWIEGMPINAIRLLMDGFGMDRNLALQVLEGRSRMENPKKKDGSKDYSTVVLRADDKDTHHGIPLKAEHLIDRFVRRLEKEREVYREVLEQINDEGSTYMSGEFRTFHPDRNITDDYIDTGLRAARQGMSRAWVDMPGPLPFTVEGFIDHMDRMGDVEFGIDKDFEYEEGWLAPNGDFWGCLYMQHIELAKWLVEEMGLEVTEDGDSVPHADRVLEKLGWLKIFQSQLTGKRHLWMKPVGKPTLAQLSTMGDYEKKWDKLVDFLNIEVLLEEVKG